MLIALFLACSMAPPPPPVAPVEDVEATTAAAAVICKAAEQIGTPCTSAAGVATFGESKLTTAVTVTSFNTLPPRTLGGGSSAQQIPGEAQLGLTVALSVDDAPLMTIDISHAASDPDLEVARAKVLDEALQRWMAGYGIAVLDAVIQDAAAPALGSLGMKVPAPDAGAWRAWAGYPMLRGQGFDPGVVSKLGPSVGSMLGAFAPYLNDLDPEKLHSVRVTAKLGGGGAPGPCGIMPTVSMAPGSTSSIVPLAGQVLVDGATVGTICDLSERVSWPLPQGGALLTWDQFAVVRVLPDPE